MEALRTRYKLRADGKPILLTHTIHLRKIENRSKAAVGPIATLIDTVESLLGFARPLPENYGARFVKVRSTENVKDMIYLKVLTET